VGARGPFERRRHHPGKGDTADGELLRRISAGYRADEGNRTPNLLITNQLLYQLSYVSQTQLKENW
jgi:hypothetical protein